VNLSSNQNRKNIKQSTQFEPVQVNLSSNQNRKNIKQSTQFEPVQVNLSSNQNRKNKLPSQNIPKQYLNAINETLSGIKPEPTLGKITATVNNILLKKPLHAEESSLKNNEQLVNNMLKYYIPSTYSKPSKLCKDSDKCELTKRELCQVITENFIVRNNIIAAILSAIPYESGTYKDEEGKIKKIFEGGICYQKFLKLNKCEVCIPASVLSKKEEDIHKSLKTIHKTADFLTKKLCEDNRGIFYKLSKSDKKNLYSKINGMTEEEIKNHPTIRFNKLFIDSIEKVRNHYFNGLNSLIGILNKIQESSIISNSSLNRISEETKLTIDHMYNICHYYYVFGIYSLINSDISSEKKVDPKIDEAVRLFKLGLNNSDPAKDDYIPENPL
jgi:hypothetical protein